MDGRLAEIVDEITAIDQDILDCTPERQQWSSKVETLVQEAYEIGRSAR